MTGAVAELEKCLARLPGFGRRSAQRAALALVREKERLLRPLSAALAAADSQVRCCSRCGGFTEAGADPCALCTDATRDGRSLCVVEEPADIVSLEASGAFRGRYHSLGGKLSPARRTGPERLRFAELRDRVVREGVEEVLLFVFVTLLHCNDMLIKVIGQVVVVVLNYVISKLLIFRKKKEEDPES